MSKKNSKKQVQIQKATKKTREAKAASKVVLSADFYPLVGTAFVKENRVYIVEDQELLSVFSEDGDVCCVTVDEGTVDFPKWIDEVQSGNVQIIWCPKQGRVNSNDDYLKRAC